jgi:hypothetical protein
VASQNGENGASHAFRFDFDRANGILLARFEGQLTNESAAEYYEAIRKYATATDARSCIWDLSSVTEFAVSAEFIRSLGERDPAMPHADKRPRIIVAAATAGFGLMRMLQIVGEKKRPMLRVVHTLDEALAELGVQSPRFEPLE